MPHDITFHRNILSEVTPKTPTLWWVRGGGKGTLIIKYFIQFLLRVGNYAITQYVSSHSELLKRYSAYTVHRSNPRRTGVGEVSKECVFYAV